MNYLLVEPEKLEGKLNHQFAEKLPDGRVILPISVAKMITGLKGVDMVGLDELNELKSQSQPEIEGETPEVGETIPEIEEGIDDSSVEQLKESEVTNE